MLRDSLRREGYEAKRVPLSGASPGYKGDIAVSKGTDSWTLEAKLRAPGTFSRIYSLFDQKQKDGSFAVAYGDETDLSLVSIHSTFASATLGPIYYNPTTDYGAEEIKAVKKLVSIKGMMQDCNYLVIREDRKPFLYVRYR